MEQRIFVSLLRLEFRSKGPVLCLDTEQTSCEVKQILFYNSINSSLFPFISILHCSSLDILGRFSNSLTEMHFIRNVQSMNTLSYFLVRNFSLFNIV